METRKYKTYAGFHRAMQMYRDRIIEWYADDYNYVVTMYIVTLKKRGKR